MKEMNLHQIYGVEYKGKIVYVGVTKQDIRQRISNHLSHAKRGYRGADKFGNWLLKSPKFSVKILEYCHAEIRYDREKFWIAHYNTIAKGYNQEHFKNAPGREKGCDNPSGKDHYMWGKPACKAAVAASVAARTGKKLSEEHRQKMREGHARRKALLAK